MASLPLVEIMREKGREKEMLCMCERKRVRERKSERQGEGDKKARKWGSEIRKSERQSHDRKTDKEIKQGNGRERSLGGGSTGS